MTLRLSEDTRAVLAELHAYAEIEDPLARERVYRESAARGSQLSTADKYELYGDAPPLAVSASEGDILYFLVRLLRPRNVVEFGSSHGISTIYLAAGLRDNGGGHLVTTEIRAAKVAATRKNLTRAGLIEVVEIRLGDARESLEEIDGLVDLVFLDGRNDLYLDVLRVLEPHLSERAVIIADLSPDDPDLTQYLEYVRAERFTRVELPVETGFEVSVLASGRALTPSAPLPSS